MSWNYELNIINEWSRNYELKPKQIIYGLSFNDVAKISALLIQ